MFSFCFCCFCFGHFLLLLQQHICKPKNGEWANGREDNSPHTRNGIIEQTKYICICVFVYIYMLQKKNKDILQIIWRNQFIRQLISSFSFSFSFSPWLLLEVSGVHGQYQVQMASVVAPTRRLLGRLAADNAVFLLCDVQERFREIISHFNVSAVCSN